MNGMKIEILFTSGGTSEDECMYEFYRCGMLQLGKDNILLKDMTHLYTPSALTTKRTFR